MLMFIFQVGVDLFERQCEDIDIGGILVVGWITIAVFCPFTPM